jgi:hypothetical protein
MAAAHPDIFAAVGTHSGLACGAARDMPSPSLPWAGGDGSAEGQRVERPRPSCSMATVNPVNSHHVIAQARQEAALTKMVTHDETPGGMAYQAAWPMSLLHRRGVPTFPRREVPGRGTFKGQPLHIRRCFGGPEELNCNWPR